MPVVSVLSPFAEKLTELLDVSYAKSGPQRISFSALSVLFLVGCPPSNAEQAVVDLTRATELVAPFFAKALLTIAFSMFTFVLSLLTGNHAIGLTAVVQPAFLTVAFAPHIIVAHQDIVMHLCSIWPLFSSVLTRCPINCLFASVFASATCLLPWHLTAPFLFYAVQPTWWILFCAII